VSSSEDDIGSEGFGGGGLDEGGTNFFDQAATCAFDDGLAWEPFLRFSATRSDSFRGLVATAGDDLVAIELPLSGRLDHSLGVEFVGDDSVEFLVDAMADSDPEVENEMDEREE
jgi:hypothetical protein